LVVRLGQDKIPIKISMELACTLLALKLPLSRTFNDHLTAKLGEGKRELAEWPLHFKPG
jgi:hypothetical protein